MKYTLFKLPHEPHPICQACNQPMAYIIVIPNKKQEIHYQCKDHPMKSKRCPNDDKTFSGRTVKEIEAQTAKDPSRDLQ